MRKNYEKYDEFYEDIVDLERDLKEYDNLKDGTMLSCSDTHKAIVDSFKEMNMQVTKNTKFLDIGSNYGIFTLDMSRAFGIKNDNIYCVDISKKAIDIARKRGFNASVVDLNTDKLPLDSNSIDIAFMGCVIPHLLDPDHMIKELQRTLKTGGIAGIYVPNAASWYNRIGVLLGKSLTFTDASINYTFDSFLFNDVSGHLRMYTVKSLTGLMEVHGFSIKKIVGIGVNTKIGHGKRFGLTTKFLNFIFSKPTLAASIFVIVSKK